jgi:multiple sugar transport system permease protein
MADTAVAPARRSMRAGVRKRRNIGAHLTLTVLSLILLIPLYWMVTTALKGLQEALASPPTLWPQVVQLGNFATALGQAPFGRYVLNTVIVAGVVAVGNVVLGSLAGYGLARGTFRYRTVIFAIILLTTMVPGEALFIPNFVLVHALGWYNTFQALIVPWIVTAFSIFLYRQSFLSVPEALLEAARLDGASERRIFRTIAFPLARSTSLTVFILNFVWSWNAFLWPLLVTSSQDMRTLQLGLQAFQTEGGIYVNLLMAATVLAVAPIILLFVLTQKFVISGIGEGAVK